MIRRKTTGISEEIRHSVSMIAVLLVLPVLVGVVVMVSYITRYQGMIQRMNTVAELKPALESEIEEDLFAVAAGRIAFEQSGVIRSMNTINTTLDQLTGETKGNGRLHLTIARRTMDTLNQYVMQVRDGMTERRPVAELEIIVDEVRKICRLVTDMLTDFISEEISGAAAESKRIYQWMWITAGAEIFLLAAAVLYSRNTRVRLTSSIRNAVSSMESTVRQIAEGQFDNRVGETNVEEMQELGEQINEMANQLETLMKETRKQSDHLAKAELRTMQAQINPHFLYNTLSSVLSLARRHHDPRLETMIESLSSMYRISLNQGRENITVADEIRLTENYVYIMRNRFDDLLEVTITSDPAIAESIVPKVILQPFIENSINHAMADEHVLHISVCGTIQDGDVVFTIHDDGTGITRETIQAIFAAQGEAQKGFGIRNVHQRIQMLYGSQYGVTIEPMDIGTRVTLRLPYCTLDQLPQMRHQATEHESRPDTAGKT